MPAAAQLVLKYPVDGTDSAAAETGRVLRVGQVHVPTQWMYLAVPESLFAAALLLNSFAL